MVDFKDYYKILGISKKASSKEVKEAFRQLAKQYHPDSEGGSEEKFKDINEAYEVLKDSKKKHKYDMMAKYQSSFEQPNKGAETPSQASQAYKQSKMYTDFQSFSEYMNYKDFEKKKTTSKKPSPGQKKKDSTFSDFFEMLFGKQEEQQKAKAKSSARPKRGDDYEMDLELSLMDAYEGCVRKIEISGSSNKTRRLEVTIPAGVKEGNKIKVSNEGKPGKNGGKSGDLYLKVKIKSDDDFWIENDDVHSNLELFPHEAVLGCDKKIATLSGTVELTIPPKTQSNKTLRLRAKGLKSSSKQAETLSNDGYGDHYVHIAIIIPTNPSQEELELYRKIKSLSEN